MHQCGEIMKKKNYFGYAFFLIGILLIASAIIISLNNISEEKNAGDKSDEIVDIIAQAMEQDLVSSSDVISFTDSILEVEEEKMVEIDGDKYIGVLTIPDLGLVLPVGDELSMVNLKISPCRYIGRAGQKNFIIGAHNYATHFGRLNSLENGAEILFTEPDGKTYRYVVEEQERLRAHEAERLMKSDYDLTLFTCTIGGSSRVVVRCRKII